MKRLLGLIMALLLLTACSPSEASVPATSAPATSAPATSAPATTAPATTAPATTAPASEEETDDDSLEAFLEEWAALEAAMAPKQAEVNAGIDGLIPDEHKDERWYYAEAIIWDENLFVVDIQINVPGADLDAAKEISVDIIKRLKPLETQLDFNCDHYSVMIVDDGEFIAYVSTTENPNEYSAMLEDASEDVFVAE